MPIITNESLLPPIDRKVGAPDLPNLSTRSTANRAARQGSVQIEQAKNAVRRTLPFGDVNKRDLLRSANPTDFLDPQKGRPSYPNMEKPGFKNKHKIIQDDTL